MQDNLLPDQDMPGINGKARPSHEDVARIAYFLWIERGRPDGSPEEDWHRAENQLSAHSETREVPEEMTEEIV